MTRMDAVGVLLDGFSFNTVIRLYVRKGMQYEAMCVRERTGNDGVKADIVTGNTTIHGLCKVGVMKEAAQLHRDMITAGVEPGTVTHTRQAMWGRPGRWRQGRCCRVSRRTMRLLGNSVRMAR